MNEKSDFVDIIPNTIDLALGNVIINISMISFARLHIVARIIINNKCECPLGARIL